VELLGTLDGAGDAADHDPVNRFSGKVQAVVALFAPSDLPTMFPATARQGTVSALMGFAYQDPALGGGARADDEENRRYRDASPVSRPRRICPRLHAACVEAHAAARHAD